MPNVSSKKVLEYVKLLDLKPHPEGGYYKETYRSPDLIEPDGFEAKRNVSTGIYYLLESGSFSAFHRIKSDEMWHFYDGTDLSVYCIDDLGKLIVLKLGHNIKAGEQLQGVVPAGSWFASRVEAANGFALVGCTVAPGFDFRDFEMADRQELSSEFPQHADLIKILTR